MKNTIAILILLFATSASSVLWAQNTFSDPNFTKSTKKQEQREQPVSKEDLMILNRVDELLANESVWNRNDERVCDDDESTGVRSLFCALLRASVDVLGKYDHRRVALQEVRFAITDAVNGRRLGHRLKDFNNLKETSFLDLKSVISVAIKRVEQRLDSTN